MPEPRVLPNNLEAEKSILGTSMIAENVFNDIAILVKQVDFYAEKHRYIFGAMVDLSSGGNPVDLVTVTSKLRDSGLLEKAGGIHYITGLTDIIPFAGMAAHHANLISKKAILRRIISAGQLMIEKCYASADSEISEIIAETESALLSATEGAGSEASHMREIAASVAASVEQRQSVPGSITGLSTGFSELDRMTAGLHPQEFIVIAGRPSQGKSAIAFNIAVHVAQSGSPVGVFSLEMGKDALGERIIAQLGRINATGMRKGTLHPTDYQQFIKTAEIAKKIDIYIDDTTGLTLTDLRIKARRMKRKFKIELLIVDYLQLMDGSANNREQVIAEISRGLKGLSKELDIPVVALAQLNRGPDNRPDHRPTLADLRESGAIEQDTDGVFFLYRDDMYRKTGDMFRDNLANFIIAKQRQGPLGDFKLNFEGQYSLFSDLTSSVTKKPWE